VVTQNVINKMKYQEIIGNLIELSLSGSFDVIAQGNNCQNAQGAGIAPQFVKAFGTDRFELEHNNFKGDVNKLGNIDYELRNIKNPKSKVFPKMEGFIKGEDFFVVNCYTQFMYSTNHTDGVSKPLDYEALTLCLRKINHIFKDKHIGLPGFIGGGLAGGNIDIIRSIIQKELKDMDVTIVFLEQNKHLMLNRKIFNQNNSYRK
jgi:O-acetyl-ADP-ribose deacetylase (regulator of RNase III)